MKQRPWGLVTGMSLLLGLTSARAEDATPATGATSSEPAVRAEPIEDAPPPPAPSQSTPPAPSPPPAPSRALERYTLANGLSVALDPLPGTGAVAIAVVYHAGASEQPTGHTGLAHITEHMMFEGSLHAPRHFSVEIEALGAIDSNAMTARDRTVFYETVPPEQLERALFLEADRMAFVAPALREDRLANQRAVVLRERVERVDLGGLGMIPGLLASVLYPAPHPYADLFENREDLESIRIEDVTWFLQTWYAPDNATLAVSGDFDASTVRAIVERAFGPIVRTGTRPEPRQVPPVRQLDAERRLVVEAYVRRDELLVIWPTPAWGTAEDAVLDLVARELDRRLTTALVDTGRVTEVTVAQASSDVASELQISVVTGRGRGTLEALEAVDREVARLRDAELPAGTVAELGRTLVEREMLAMADLSYRAKRLAEPIPLAPGGYWSRDWSVDRWTRVDPATLRRTVQEWLPAGRRLVLSLAADREAPIEGRIAVDLTLPLEGTAP